ncbi:MAG TPA: hypothetical protein VF171_00605 [Trueperaceae bacterium]
MQGKLIKKLALCTLVLLAGSAWAFKWEPNVIPPGNHSYTLQLISTAEDAANEVATITIAITQNGDSYQVDTTYALNQKDIPEDSLQDALYGGAMLGMMAFGPMLMYGGGFTFLPMMIGEEDIHVRQEPMILMGMGKIYMDKAIMAAGRQCVVLRFEPSDGSDPMEFALAENTPFPCYSRYSNGDGSYTEIRLIQAD